MRRLLVLIALLAGTFGVPVSLHAPTSESPASREVDRLVVAAGVAYDGARMAWDHSPLGSATRAERYQMGRDVAALRGRLAELRRLRAAGESATVCERALAFLRDTEDLERAVRWAAGARDF